MVEFIFILETVSEHQAQIQIYKMQMIDLEAQIQQNPSNIHKQQAEPDVARGDAPRALTISDPHPAYAETGAHADSAAW